jgi:hypothetical protein
MLRDKNVMRQPDVHEKQDDNRIKTSAHVAESFGKIAVAITGICFLTGLIITNLYLLRWGIVDFSIVKTKYVLTGAIFFFVNGFLYLPLFFVTSLLPSLFKKSGYSIFKRIIICLAISILVFFLSFVVFWLLLVPIVNKDYSPFSEFYVINWEDIWPFAALYPTLLLSHIFFVTGIKRRFLLREIFLFTFSTAWIVNLTLFASLIYPRINPQFGGGRPLKATFLLNENVNKVLPMGLKIRGSPTLAEWALIHERENEYIIAAFNDSSRTINIITLSKMLTYGFVLDERRLYESTTESIKAGAIYTAGPTTWRILISMSEAGFSIDDMNKQTQLLESDISNFLLVKWRIETALRKGENMGDVMEGLVKSNANWKGMAEYIFEYIFLTKVQEAPSDEGK